MTSFFNEEGNFDYDLFVQSEGEKSVNVTELFYANSRITIVDEHNPLMEDQKNGKIN